MDKKSENIKKQKNIHAKTRIGASVLLLLLSAVLMICAAQMPEFAEWYSQHIYSVIVSVAARISGIFWFSVAEVCLYIFLIAFFVSLAVAIRNEYSAWRKTEIAGRGESFYRWFSCVILVVAVLCFLYVVCCGINYHRKSFSEEEGIVTYDYKVEDLEKVCVWLTGEVNVRAENVERDGNGVMELQRPEQEGAVEAMEKLGEEFEGLRGYYPCPKKLIVSEILSYQSLTGVYSPFTVEANYNGDMTAYNIPFTACHELSHLRGFMQEEEANFIAFLACIGSDREDFQYSGYLSGWVYCMNALYRADHEAWAKVRELLEEEAEPDLEANNTFWERYEGRISETAEKINDTYLKANGQAQGVQSYDRMVDLIVACFCEK